MKLKEEGEKGRTGERADNGGVEVPQRVGHLLILEAASSIWKSALGALQVPPRGCTQEGCTEGLRKFPTAFPLTVLNCRQSKDSDLPGRNLDTAMAFGSSLQGHLLAEIMLRTCHHLGVTLQLEN